MNLGIKREITVGQVIVTAVAALTLIGSVFTTYSEVQQLKKDVTTFASVESVETLKENVKEMRTDIGDIKSLMYWYARRASRADRDTALDSPVERRLAQLDSTLNKLR